ncbi:MAG: ubiquitin-like protein [Candidatus Helarchaeota archaeon]
MDLIKPLKVKFKLENRVVEEEVVQSWTIGKIKGRLRKVFQINAYYELQLLYNGRVLENTTKFKEINYVADSLIKVMAVKGSEL